jgi:hypothetical protein
MAGAIIAAMVMPHLVDALRCGLVGDRPPDLPPAAARLAARHRVLGLLYHIGARLGEPDAAAAEATEAAEAARAAEAAWSQNLAGHLARKAALARIWPAHIWPEGGAAPLVIKGADLAENLYDDPGARAANDLDLLLPDPAFTALAAAFAALPIADRRPPPRYERFARETPASIGLAVDGVLIELHRHVAPPHRLRLSTAALWSRGHPDRWGEVPVRWPSPLDRLLIWLANAASDAFHHDLAALYDLALILRALGGLEARPDWLGWRRHAASAGLGNAFDLAVHRLASSGLWPGRLPDRARPAVYWADRLLPSVFEGRSAPSPVRFQAVKLWLCDGAHRPGVLARAAATLARGEFPSRG